MNASTLALIGQVLGQAEAFIAGQSVQIAIPAEKIDLGGFSLEVSGSLVIKKA